MPNPRVKVAPKHPSEVIRMRMPHHPGPRLDRSSGSLATLSEFYKGKRAARVVLRLGYLKHSEQAIRPAVSIRPADRPPARLSNRPRARALWSNPPFVALAPPGRLSLRP